MWNTDNGANVRTESAARSTFGLPLMCFQQFTDCFDCYIVIVLTFKWSCYWIEWDKSAYADFRGRLELL